MEGVGKKLLDQIGKDTLDWLKSQGIGITLFTFTFDAGAIAYISNANREDMIKVIREWIALQEVGVTTGPPGEKAQG